MRALAMLAVLASPSAVLADREMIEESVACDLDGDGKRETVQLIYIEREPPPDCRKSSECVLAWVHTPHDLVLVVMDSEGKTLSRTPAPNRGRATDLSCRNVVSDRDREIVLEWRESMSGVCFAAGVEIFKWRPSGLALVADLYDSDRLDNELPERTFGVARDTVRVPARGRPVSVWRWDRKRFAFRLAQGRPLVRCHADEQCQ